MAVRKSSQVVTTVFIVFLRGKPGCAEMSAVRFKLERGRDARMCACGVVNAAKHIRHIHKRSGVPVCTGDANIWAKSQLCRFELMGAKLFDAAQKDGLNHRK